jgi:hypothetical protein
LIKEEDLSPTRKNFDDEMDDDTPVLWESCWCPILSLLCDGAGDPRREVSVASVHALVKTLGDKHVSAVPAGILVDILSRIVGKTAVMLGEKAAEDARKHREHSSSAEPLSHLPLPPGSISAPDGASSDANASGKNGSGKGASSPARMGPAAECVGCLCDCLLRELPKLSQYPSFDKLWLSFLHVFGYYLGAPHGFDHSLLPAGGVSSSAASSSSPACELESATAVAEEQLQSVLAALTKAKVFTIKEGLLDVTKETIASFQIKLNL